ncbi:MAG: hypothetical protein CMM39_10465 [Rhodospirillaceae bacterium]|nr:hypothetical protein [Rhodospirillaceae bacterium]MDG1275394.1 hypothetical protein [Alphaproteobacteria bacterium]MDG1888346.1 hypothetical protein [Alphaproteobacteria bacterium]
MIEDEFLKQIAKDHKKNLLDRDQGKLFLKELMGLCEKHRVLLRTTDQTIRFSKNFGDATMRTTLVAMIDKNNNCPAAKIELK